MLLLGLILVDISNLYKIISIFLCIAHKPHLQEYDCKRSYHLHQGPTDL